MLLTVLVASPSYGQDRCDMNCDGQINFDDIDPFILAITSERSYRKQYPNCCLNSADANGDGVLDFDDIDPFVECLVIGGPGERLSPIVMVDAGWFEMGDPWDEGDPDELPVHSVFVSTFGIDQYEVTNDLYCRFLNDGGNDVNWDPGQLILRDEVDGRLHYSVVSGYENHPVVYVSYYDAVAFCEWRSMAEDRPKGTYRLPTEAEWEKAAGWDPVDERLYRYGDHSDGDGPDRLGGDRANFLDSGDPHDNGTTPIGYYNGSQYGDYVTQKAQCFYGCYDMSGNVWEWCYDWAASDYYAKSPDKDPIGPDDGMNKIFRGGSWGDTTPRLLRTANRTASYPSYRGPAVGFRCAASVPQCVDKNFVLNGEFEFDSSGWTRIDFGDANWFDQRGGFPGWDGQPGWFFVNDSSGKIPKTCQRISGLMVGETYRVSGYYFRDTENFGGSSFQVLIDDVEMFRAAGKLNTWLPFTFTFEAASHTALLCFRSQLDGDDAHGIDHITISRE